MQKDFKIGMLLGLLLVAAAGLWLSTRPSLSTKARLLRDSEQTGPPIETEQINEQRATNNKQQATRYHIVREGETLSSIAYKYYGWSNDWQKIFDANREIINDANKIRPGTKLLIPD